MTSVLQVLADVLSPDSNLPKISQHYYSSRWLEASKGNTSVEKGDKYMPSIYCPISLTWITCNIMEHIVTSQLTRHLENKGKLNQQQHGFRKFCCCESQLTVLTCDISKKLDEGNKIDAVFLDFRKPLKRLMMMITTTNPLVNSNPSEWATR